jgi:hypothetical protein
MSGVGTPEAIVRWTVWEFGQYMDFHFGRNIWYPISFRVQYYRGHEGEEQTQFTMQVRQKSGRFNCDVYRNAEFDFSLVFTMADPRGPRLHRDVYGTIQRGPIRGEQRVWLETTRRDD